MANTTVPVNLSHAGQVYYFQFAGSGTTGDPFTLASITANVTAATEVGELERPTVTISASPDYAIGDAIGGIVTIPGVMADTGRAAKLQSIELAEDSGQVPGLVIYLFRASPSGGTYTDNAAFAWGSGDTAKKVATIVVPPTAWKTVASKSAVNLSAIDAIMDSVTADLYMVIVADTAYNAAGTGDLKMALGFQQL